MKHYRHVTVGGTFDRFHIGHQSLLDHAFRVSDIVSIAVMEDSFVRKKLLGKYVEPYEKREKNLIDYLKNKNVYKKARIIPINDFYGFSLTDKTLEAIIATKETRHNAVKINAKRKTMHLPKLAIVEVQFVKGSDRKIIRSERIRLGETDRTGDRYTKIFRKKRAMVLPHHLRAAMRKPLGKVVKDEHSAVSYIKTLQPSLVITVGDIVSQTLHTAGLTPHLTIVDFKSLRKELKESTLTPPHRNLYANRAGTINYTPVSILKTNLKHIILGGKKISIGIHGEEDLLALPAILLAPLDSVVVYGQWEIGIVITHVTESIKEKVKNLLLQFK